MFVAVAVAAAASVATSGTNESTITKNRTVSGQGGRIGLSVRRGAAAGRKSWLEPMRLRLSMRVCRVETSVCVCVCCLFVGFEGLPRRRTHAPVLRRLLVLVSMSSPLGG